jgi:hypothetical protein
MSEQTGQARRDPRVKVSELRRDYPAYEIGLMSTEVWQAVSYPSPSRMVLHVAFILDELRAKIEGDSR